MKIFILGCGGVGACAAALFARERDVEKILVGDMNLARANKLVQALKGLNVSVETEAIEVDGTRQDDVARAAEGVDFIYNATVPKCNIPILKACIKVGASYVDAAAFPPFVPSIPEEETIPALMALDGDAKSAGITAITCLGIAPGWSNIAANYIISQMDSAEKARFKWFNYVEANDLVGTWWPAALMEEFLGGPHPIIWENGEFKAVDLLKGAEIYEYPEPIGKRTAYTAIFHPELWMLPTFLPDGRGKSLKYIDMMGGMDIGDLKMKDVWIEAIHRQTVKPAFEKAIRGPEDMFEALGSSFNAPSDFKEAFDNGIIKNDHNTTVVEVTGLKNGKKIKHTMGNTSSFSDSRKIAPWSSSVSYATSQPGVTIGLMVLRGEINRKGVIVPDQLEQPELILRKLASEIVILTEKIEREFSG